MEISKNNKVRKNATSNYHLLPGACQVGSFTSEFRISEGGTAVLMGWRSILGPHVAYTDFFVSA
jgi:hypothetical protein